MNLIELTKRYPTEREAVIRFERVRWHKGKTCPFCRSKRISGRQSDFRYRCYKCKRSFSVTTKTRLHNTRLPLRTWLFAFAIISDAKKGVSAKQLERNLGVHYETAWKMGHKIRKIMEAPVVLEDVVEMDDAMLGGKPRKNARMLLSDADKKRYDKKLGKWKKKHGFDISEGKKKKRYPATKPKRGMGADRPKVVGLVERGGNAVIKIMDKITYRQVKALVQKHVDTSNAVLIHDNKSSYRRLDEIIERTVIDHKKMYSYKGINTNTIESFWALIKRGLVGTYHHVSEKYLPDYVVEWLFKYNNRFFEDGYMFETLIRNAMKRAKPKRK